MKSGSIITVAVTGASGLLGRLKITPFREAIALTLESIREAGGIRRSDRDLPERE